MPNYIRNVFMLVIVLGALDAYAESPLARTFRPEDTRPALSGSGIWTDASRPVFQTVKAEGQGTAAWLLTM